MKELSIKEKAKRYDKAIEIAKEINNEQRAQPFNVMTRVFPELKESDDKDVRKELIEFIRRLNIVFDNDEQKNRFLNWLEKQGEQKPVEWSEEDMLQYSKILFCLDSMVFPSTEERQEMMNWLKSLKPNHWKPSEKQIEALSNAISLLSANPVSDMLDNLHDDLKNL